MEVHELTVRESYDPATQRMIGSFIAQLDDQSTHLKKSLGMPSIAELEWQLDKGMNSIGMLLAHNAIVEAFWINVAPLGIGQGSESEKRIKGITGIGGNDDGIPLPPDGTHPDTLKGYNLDDYLGMLDSTREATHTALMSWTDGGIEESYMIEGHLFTKAWTLYHVLEHFIGHCGQVRLLKRIIKDRGLV